MTHSIINALTKYKAQAIPFLLLYNWLVIQTAWTGDDAFITFRSIENFIHGYGPVFNVGERVQTFTHPLWFLVQSAANLMLGFWKENPLGQGQMYFLNIFVSIALSFLTLLIFTFIPSSSTNSTILGIVILTLSKAFLDYSTSGLENPLTNLILILFISIYLTQKEKNRHHLLILAVLTALAGLNRLDTMLFFLPILGLLFWQSQKKWKAFLTISLGFLPLVVWELFSIFYYGTPYPNTAYAKINTGIPVLSLIRQGMFYYSNSLKLDPITLLAIFTIIIVVLTQRNSLHKTIITGVLLYMLYTIYIGGDFMSGRYFSAPLLACCAILSKIEFKSLKFFGLSLGLALIIGIAPIYVIPERNPAFDRGAEGGQPVLVDEHGIADERNIYRGSRLLRSLQKGAPVSPYTREQWIFDPNTPVKVKLVGPLGLRSYISGPNVHMIDMNALADPLMARLPIYEIDHWRIGHFRHIIPEGYLETLESGENRITNKNIALYYDKLAFVIRGELWSWPRLVEIWYLNTGKYDYLIQDVTEGS